MVQISLFSMRNKSHNVISVSCVPSNGSSGAIYSCSTIPKSDVLRIYSRKYRLHANPVLCNLTTFWHLRAYTHTLTHRHTLAIVYHFSWLLCNFMDSWRVRQQSFRFWCMFAFCLLSTMATNIIIYSSYALQTFIMLNHGRLFVEHSNTKSVLSLWTNRSRKWANTNQRLNGAEKGLDTKYHFDVNL